MRPHRATGSSASFRVASTTLALLAASAAGAAEPLCDGLGALGDAAAALDAGDPPTAIEAARRAAIALPGGEPLGRARAIEGFALLRLGRLGEAGAPLSEAASEAPVEARPAIRLALAEALLGAGRSAEAAAALTSATEGPSLLARRARWLEARARLAAGADRPGLALAEPLLRAFPADPEALRTRLEAAAAERRLGHLARAHALYRGLALEEPDRPEGQAALEALAAWHAEGGPVTPLGGLDRLARAERLLARGRPALALEEAGLARTATAPAPPSRAALMEAFALLALGRLEEAERTAASLAVRGQEAGVRRGAGWVLARTAARAGRMDEAARRYGQVAEASGTPPGMAPARWLDLADEAGFLAAWLAYDAGELAVAARQLDAFARAHPASRRAVEARWFAAWARYRLGDRERARRALAQLEGGPLADAALYWQARLEADPARTVSLLQRAAAAAPDGWYGALARARLAAGPSPLPLPPPGVERERPAGAQPPLPSGERAGREGLTLDSGPAARRLEASAVLLGLGWRDAARAELDDLLRRGPRALAAPLAELAAFAGDAELPFRAARDVPGTGRRAARWLYPEPHPRLPEIAAAAGVDADLLRAVVRKESAFRPDARSGAGAVGLSQLLPATAARLSALSGLKEEASGPLEDPAASAGLGAHYLALLLDRFGAMGPALAAYNAGPARAEGWARERAGLPLDEWVEAIPFKETRGYVKAVLAGREAYRRLSGLPPALDPDQPVAPPGDGAAF